MDSINALTFHQGKRANARRVGAIPELNCIGGNARHEAQRHVHAIQCRKVGAGFSGNGIQWRCEADLPHELKLGETTISCEGYDHPNDPYVLQGSCGLEYTLHRTGASPHSPHYGYVQNYHSEHHNSYSNSGSDWLGIMFMAAMAYALSGGTLFWTGLSIYALAGMDTLLFMGMLYYFLLAPPARHNRAARHNRWWASNDYGNRPWYGGCGNGFDRGHGHGYGHHGYCGDSGSFLSGLGVGAAANHMFSGRSNYNRPRYTYNSGSSGRPSGVSIGFGGTRNR
jgi:hypothetical protein